MDALEDQKRSRFEQNTLLIEGLSNMASHCAFLTEKITVLTVNSYGAIVAQERQKVDCRDYATRRVSTKRAKCSRYEQSTLQIKGFMCGLSPYYFVKKNLPISPVG